jgi:hypothetical protein
MSFDPNEPRFGTPAHTAHEWLCEFIVSCEEQRRRSVNPLDRIRLRAMSKAYSAAAELLERRSWGDVAS